MLASAALYHPHPQPGGEVGAAAEEEAAMADQEGGPPGGIKCQMLNSRSSSSSQSSSSSPESTAWSASQSLDAALSRVQAAWLVSNICTAWADSLSSAGASLPPATSAKSIGNNDQTVKHMASSKVFDQAAPPGVSCKSTTVSSSSNGSSDAGILAWYGRGNDSPSRLASGLVKLLAEALEAMEIMTESAQDAYFQGLHSREEGNRSGPSGSSGLASGGVHWADVDTEWCASYGLWD